MSNVQILVAVAVVAIVFLVLLGIRYRYRNFTIPQLMLWLTAKLIVRVLWRAEQPKRLPVERGQGAIVVCNHRSSIDPFFIQTIVDYPMRWMVAREYFESGLMGWFLRTCNAIPVGRGGVDTAATKTAIRFASEGGLVGMLPEGRINITDEFMLPVRPGAVMVALHAGVPILPCYIEGSPYAGSVSSPMFMRAKVRVVVGELFDLSPFYSRKAEEGLARELILQVVNRIAELAGRHDFEPKLAGRKWKPSHPEAPDEATKPLSE